MPLYRGAQAELRRVHREARWVLAGVFIDGRWHRASRSFAPASARLVESGLVVRVALPDFIAPPGRAVAVALTIARGLALDAASVAPHERLRGGPNPRIDVDLP